MSRKTSSKFGNSAAFGCGGLFGAVWIIIWSAGTLAFDVLCVRGIVMQTIASDYPSVPGKVFDSRVETRHDSDGTTYKGRVRYAYTVNGQRYESHRVRYGMESGGRKTSRSFVQRHPVGSTVTVYYDPAEPADALLEPGVSGVDLFMILFLTPFNVVMLGSWVFATGCLGRASPEARFLRRVHQRHGITVVRLPGVTPLAAAALAAAGIAFVLIFVVGLSTGMRPSVTLTGIALALVVAGAVWAGRIAHRNLQRGDRDLEIDPVRRTVAFPLRKKQEQRTTIGFDQVNEVQVKRIVKTDSDSTTINFVPTVRWTHAAGTPHTTGLSKFSDEDEARAMQRWLMEQVGASDDRSREAVASSAND